MVIDAAKGIEARTRKLFEVCRLRDIPIVTFINKMDREARDPFELLDEIEKTLALDAAPVTWPVGRGRRLRRHLRSASQRASAGSTRDEAAHAGLRARTTRASPPSCPERALAALARGGRAGAGRPASRSTWRPSAKAT